MDGGDRKKGKREGGREEQERMGELGKRGQGNIEKKETKNRE